MFMHPTQEKPTKTPRFVVILMAGGEGKRMNSNLPKVLHPVLGKPMLVRILETVQKVSPSKILIVTGKHHSTIQQTLKPILSKNSNIEFIQQPSPLGTGNAIQCCLSSLESDDYVLILNGDMPCIHEETIVQFVNECEDAGLITMNLDEPKGYGRILKNGKKEFQGIREDKDCTEEEKKIKEVNCGIYYFQSMILKTYIPKITNQNVQNEYYLTDIFDIINRHEDLEYYVYQIPEENKYQMMGVNTPEELQNVEKRLRK